MKALLTYLVLVAAVAAPAAVASPRFITDTLGGNGHPQAMEGLRLITDTLGGNGMRRDHTSRGRTVVSGGPTGSITLQSPDVIDRVQKVKEPGYRFMTDTLAPGGGGSAAPTDGTSFNWRDAGAGTGVGFATAAGLAMLIALRKRARQQSNHAV